LTSRLKNIDEKINNTELSTEKRFMGVDESISKNTLYWLIAVLATALLSALAYVFLSRKQKADRKDLIGQLTKTKSSIEENLVKEFTRQTELMEAQLKLSKDHTGGKANEVIQDHSFALKVADEIAMFERNLSFMDSKTKGMKQLNSSISRLKDNLEGNGYEVPELLGKKFHNGMKLVVINSVQDENLKPGEEIISKIVKPQVNFEGKMIQAAQIEVSVG
jgi:molybdopterin converting factor small subunit